MAVLPTPVPERFAEGGYVQPGVYIVTSPIIDEMPSWLYPNGTIQTLMKEQTRRIVLENDAGQAITVEIDTKDNTVNIDADALVLLLGAAGYSKVGE